MEEDRVLGRFVCGSRNPACLSFHEHVFQHREEAEKPMVSSFLTMALLAAISQHVYLLYYRHSSQRKQHIRVIHIISTSLQDTQPDRKPRDLSPFQKPASLSRIRPPPKHVHISSTLDPGRQESAAPIAKSTRALRTEKHASLANTTTARMLPRVQPAKLTTSTAYFILLPTVPTKEGMANACATKAATPQTLPPASQGAAKLPRRRCLYLSLKEYLLDRPLFDPPASATTRPNAHGAGLLTPRQSQTAGLRSVSPWLAE